MQYIYHYRLIGYTYDTLMPKSYTAKYLIYTNQLDYNIEVDISCTKRGAMKVQLKV